MESTLIFKVFGVLLFLAELIYFKIADRLNIIDKPNQRSSHDRITLLGGGVVFYFGVLLYSIWFGVPHQWFLAGLTLIAGISFLDDIRPIRSSVRLVLIALVFCTGVINAFNFMDGINGITGAYSFVVLLVLSFINKQVVDFIDHDYLYTVLIAVAVFNFFNFRKNAKCFAGDVGAVGIAFIILFALGKLMLATGDFSYIVILAVYGVDSVLTIIHRLMLRENIFDAHRKHAYQIMANELKLPHVVVSSFYAAMQALVIGGYFVFFENRWAYIAVVISLLCVAYVLFMKKFFYLHLQRMAV